MSEKEWTEKIKQFFTTILIKNGYCSEDSEILGFYISELLLDAKPLIEISNRSLEDELLIEKLDLEDIAMKVHMLFNHKNLMDDGYKILTTV